LEANIFVNNFESKCFSLAYFCAIFKIMIKKAFVFLLLIQGTAVAQYKNAVRANLSGAAIQIYSLQYERSLGSRFGFNNTFFFRPKSTIPFGKVIDDFSKKNGVGLTGIKFEHIFMNEAQVGLKGYSPELRYYMGKNRKVFLGAFGLYEEFDMKVPAMIGVMKDNRYLEVKLPIDFTFNTLSGGLLIGRSFTWNKVGLDLVFVGPHIGKAHKFFAQGENSNLVGLNPDEKEFVKNAIKDRFGLRDKYFSMDMVDDAAEIRSIRSVPFFGIRGLGVNLSYRF
jgi:hypothetical protein